MEVAAVGTKANLSLTAGGPLGEPSIFLSYSTSPL